MAVGAATARDQGTESSFGGDDRSVLGHRGQLRRRPGGTEEVALHQITARRPQTAKLVSAAHTLGDPIHELFG